MAYYLRTLHSTDSWEVGKKPLFVYVMNRIQGISYLDFVLANSFPEKSDESFV